MLVFGALVRNSLLLALCLLFSVSCFFTVSAHVGMASSSVIQSIAKNSQKLKPEFPQKK